MVDTPDWQQPVNYQGQGAAVFTGSQYQPFLGNGVFLTGTAFPATNVYGSCIVYVVPAGKTFYLQGLAYGSQCATQLLYCAGKVTNNAGNVWQLINIGGQSLIFDSPVPFQAGDTVTMFALQAQTTGANANVYCNLWGWVA